MTRRLVPLVWALLAAVAVDLLLLWTGHDPQPLLLATAVLVVLASLGLLVALLHSETPTWEVSAPSDSWPRGQDPRLGVLVRTLENHLAARDPDTNLRTALRDVAARRLRRRHTMDLDDPRARELLGDDLHALLTGPPVRVDPASLHRHLERIERL